MLGFLLYTNTYMPRHTEIILISLDAYNLMKVLPDPCQLCHINNGFQPNCEDEYFSKKLETFPKSSPFWIRGNLTSNFLVNGFNACFFYLLWWLSLILVKILSKLI